MNHVRKKIENERFKFHRYLLKNGLKFTSGRKTVFETVMRAHGHFATEELVKKCRHNKQQVSRATVYRCLRELLVAGVIRETAFGEKHQHYEHLYDETHHHHARCICCGEHSEFDDLGEDKMYRSIMRKLGFTVLGHEMHFYGICKKCADNPQ